MKYFIEILCQGKVYSFFMVLWLSYTQVYMRCSSNWLTVASILLYQPLSRQQGKVSGNPGSHVRNRYTFQTLFSLWLSKRFLCFSICCHRLSSWHCLRDILSLQTQWYVESPSPEQTINLRISFVFTGSSIVPWVSGKRAHLIKFPEKIVNLSAQSPDGVQLLGTVE